LLAFVFSGCISIPGEPYLLRQREDAGRVEKVALCEGGRLERFPPAAASSREGVDPEGFTLLSWNTKKGSVEGWGEDFFRIAAGADLLALQEASLSDELRDLLYEGRYQWDMTAAFLSGDRETGVLTGSRTAPDYVCAARHPEPLVVIPKTVLVTRYPLAAGEALLVANVHLINFTVDSAEYRAQLAGLEQILSSHDGPLLVSGDFNTWNDGRSEALRELAARLSLGEVVFTDDERATFLGRVVDRVFARGLEAVEARAVPVSTSDHNPLLVTFRVSGERASL